MTDLTKLESEIESLEKGVFGNPSTEEVDSTETKEVEEGVVSGESGDKNDNDDSFSDDEPIVQETLTIPEEEHQDKPTRNDWKGKYNALDKRFRNLKASNDSTIFELRTELSKTIKQSSELSGKVNELSKELSSLKSKEDIYRDLLNEEERDIIGEDTLNSFKKLNKAAVDSAVGPLQAQLEEERKFREEGAIANAEAQQKAASTNFLNRLGDIVSDYAVYDSDPGFLKWMDGYDELTGGVRKTLFKNAQSIGDVGRVAQFFIEFKKLKDVGKSQLEQKITPATSASRTVNKTNQTPKTQYVSLAKIEKFQADVYKGRYKGQEKIVREYEAIINLAQAEGRIVA